MHMYTLFSRTLDKLQCIKTQYFILKTKIALAVENAKKNKQNNTTCVMSFGEIQPALPVWGCLLCDCGDIGLKSSKK